MPNQKEPTHPNTRSPFFPLYTSICLCMGHFLPLYPKAIFCPLGTNISFRLSLVPFPSPALSSISYLCLLPALCPSGENKPPLCWGLGLGVSCVSLGSFSLNGGGPHRECTVKLYLSQKFQPIFVFIFQINFLYSMLFPYFLPFFFLSLDSNMRAFIFQLIYLCHRR